MLCKYLSEFGKVAYNSIEEGYSESLKKAIKRVDLFDCGNNFMILDKEPLVEMAERLSKPKSPKIIVIDSIQHSRLTYHQYVELKNCFPNKLFIFISHAKGKEPKGNVADSIRYDASVKIYVEGYRAFCQSRYGGGETFTIYEDGALQYWGEIK